MCENWHYHKLGDFIKKQSIDEMKHAVHEAAPLVNNGAMFVSTPKIAFDAKTGDILWRYHKPRPEGAVILHDVSRGVALYGDKVYYAAAEAELVALDAKTGRPVWTTTVADSKAAYYITRAALIAGEQGNGRRVGRRSMEIRRRSGVGHGQLRSRHKHRLLGYAFDAKDGKIIWEFPTSSGVEAPVTTYLVDGRQYLAVLSGWGGSVWVFALE